MSKIIFEYDTVTKDCSLKLDDRELGNVELFQYNDDYGVSIVQCIEDEENNVKKHMHTSASDSPSGKEALNKFDSRPNFLLKDYVTFEGKNSVGEDIVNFFGLTS